MPLDEVENSILYYRVPVLDADTCCYCGKSLDVQKGQYFYFDENYAGKIEVAFHYCDKCNIGFRKKEELTEDIERIRSMVRHDIRIETISDPAIQKSRNVIRMINPSRADNILDRLLMETDDEYTLLSLADRLSGDTSTPNDLFVAIRTMCKFGSSAAARAWLLTKAIGVEASEIDFIKSYIEEFQTGKAVRTFGENINLSASDKKLIEAAQSSKISSVRLKSTPSKKRYVQYQDLILSGCFLSVTYVDGRSEEIAVQPQMISGYSSADIGEQSVHIQYGGETLKFVVTVEEKSIVSLSISKAPNRVEYIEGEVINLAGLEIIASYNDGSNRIITDYHFDKTGPLNIHDENIHITYGVYTISQPIKVYPKELDEIVIMSAPKQATYIEGSVFNPEGMSIVARYNNGETKSINDYQLIPDGKLSVSDKHVTIVYHGLYVNQRIDVLERLPEDIIIVRSPDKTSFIEGELFDATGMLVEATYNDGTREYVTDYTLNSDGRLTVEDNTIQIEFRGLLAEQSIKVFVGADLSRFSPYIMF